jgi:hypothetical protein
MLATGDDATHGLHGVNSPESREAVLLRDTLLNCNFRLIRRSQSGGLSSAVCKRP